MTLFSIVIKFIWIIFLLLDSSSYHDIHIWRERERKRMEREYLQFTLLNFFLFFVILIQYRFLTIINFKKLYFIHVYVNNVIDFQVVRPQNIHSLGNLILYF